MTITLAFLALLMGAVAWWLIKQSVNVQPWVAAGSARDVHGSLLAQPPAKTALWVFLAVATSLFALFVSAYAMRINYQDWSPLPQPRLLTFNTALLVLASIAIQWAVYAARRGELAGVKAGLVVAGVLTLGFIAGQFVVWKQLQGAGYFIADSAATGFFYMLTAVHGLHVVGGLIAWVRTSRRAWQGAAAHRLVLSVELCATYWHFLLAVWLVLFAVLASNFLGLSICSTSVPL